MKLILKTTLILILWNFIINSDYVSAFAKSGTISAATAYSILKRGELLNSVIIDDEFDLAKIFATKEISEPIKNLHFEYVIFLREIRYSGNEIKFNLYFRDCKFAEINIQNLKWSGSVIFEECEFSKAVILSNNEFISDINCYNSIFDSKVSVNNCCFRGLTQFMNCKFNGIRTKFSYSDFFRQANFSNSKFSGDLDVNFTIFHDDVSFVKCQIKKSAGFNNTMFKGNAEFRYCEMKEALFGNYEYMTVFQNRADFRSSIMDSAIFEYVEFNGETSFVNACFGRGGVSFQNAVFKGNITNFDAIQSRGSVFLNGAYLPSMQFHWSEIGNAILKSNPDHKLLGYFYKKLKVLGQDREAMEVYHHFRNMEMKNKLSNSSTILSEKIWYLTEWFVWGLPTGYGTKFWRILLISFCCWLLFSIPIFFKKDILVYLPDDNAMKKIEDKKTLRKLYQPIHKADLPENIISSFSFIKRICIGLYFSFALMFKIRLNTIRYIQKEKISEQSAFEKYFLFLWLLGSVLIALMGITMANNSPIIKQIVGELAF